MRILLVFTGGTIGCTEKEGVLAPDAARCEALLSLCRDTVGKGASFEVINPYTALSENNTGKELGVLSTTLSKALSRGFDGILVTHGTDTLAFTAAALGYALGMVPIPVCLVSANYPLDDARSNARDNLAGALRFILEGGEGGVFAVYRNAGENTRIHLATRLMESPAYSDRVDSVGGTFFGEWRGEELFWNPHCKISSDALPAFSPLRASHSDGILQIRPFVGMTYPPLDSGVRCVLHHSFHSGTVNTLDAAARAFFLSAKERGIPVLLTGVSGGARYESAQEFRALGITPLPQMAPVAAYLKLWYCLEAGLDVGAMQKPLAGDIFS